MYSRIRRGHAGMPLMWVAIQCHIGHQQTVSLHSIGRGPRQLSEPIAQRVSELGRTPRALSPFLKEGRVAYPLVDKS